MSVLKPFDRRSEAPQERENFFGQTPHTRGMQSMFTTNEKQVAVKQLWQAHFRKITSERIKITGSTESVSD
jgi:hypothetical protein